MSDTVRWGILGVAKIAVNKVIPATQASAGSTVAAIASRDIEKARAAARELSIPKAYGSYEELIADKEIDAIYNPLPNHLHVPWTVKAAEAGKHVLCEKPIALSAAEARELLAVRDRTGVRIEEAFMVRTHPQWLAVRDMVKSGRIGDLRSIMGFFSYFNRDPENIRNVPEWGGGGLMDIGCYLINTSRFIFGKEPIRVFGLLEADPDYGVDRLGSLMLDFSSGQCIGSFGTQLVHFQRVNIFGTKGRIELEIPFNAPSDRPSRIYVDPCSDLSGNGIELIEVPAADQYAIQAAMFSKAIREGGDLAVSLEDSINNMAVIDAVSRSASSGKWETPESGLPA
ncbi:MAG TPA: Gfo/Idh/MocA family oxidoreductase [Blastocatellia bacterium]|nr:Gfo/Idh/MocA family oxidoreductase [Blastocatellia bacterium]